MKLLFFDDYRLGVLKEGLVVDVTSALPNVGILKPQDLPLTVKGDSAPRSLVLYGLNSSVKTRDRHRFYVKLLILMMKRQKI